MNPMNAAGMNPGPGGPVGGVPMINNSSSAPRGDLLSMPESMVIQLNTYIYDYFLKRGYHDCARVLVQDDSVRLNTEPPTKSSPGHRDMNGIDADAMMTDSKDSDKLKIPDDLPRPYLPNEPQPSSFLLDWFSLFWEMFWATRKKAQTSEARQYMQHTQTMMRQREQAQNQMLRHPQLMPGQVGQMMRRPGLVPNLQKTVLQNNAGLTSQQLAAIQKSQQVQMMHHQMQREHSEMDMNGHRPQSPSSENAPSPSKRPRLEGTHMNGQQLPPNGRGQGQTIPGQPTPQALLMQNGINPGQMNPAQYRAFQQSGPAAQQKSMQVYAHNLAVHHSRSALNNQGMPNGLMNTGVMPNQNDLIIPDGLPMGSEYYGTNGQMQQARPGLQTPGGQNGTHALHDYQMQLMLLEQQNKRRLMMARQEHDSMAVRPDGQPPMPGQPGLPPGASPQGSRAGASPNPSEQMKRGTPKLPQSGLPGSPSAGDGMPQGRGSPASINFNGGQLPPEMGGQSIGQQYFVKPDGMIGANLRQPSSNPGTFNAPQMGQQLDALGRPQPAGGAPRLQGTTWQTQQQQPQQQQQQPAQQPGPQGQPMVPQQSQANQHQPSGTPQERNAMPPPQAPTAGAANTGRTPSSPQSNPAPPTPQQSNKPNPKTKKDPKDSRKRPPKKATAATNAANAIATPSSEAEPPTPTPSTPITPQNPNSFNKAIANAATSAPQQPTSAPVVPQPPDPNQTFNDLNITDGPTFSLDFGGLDNQDILENFDFDTFLNTDGDSTGFGFDASMPYADGVETGATDGL